MSDRETNRPKEIPRADDQWTINRPEPADPAENLYDAPVAPSDAPHADVGGTGDSLADQSQGTLEATENRYSIVEGEPATLEIAQRTELHEPQGNNELGYLATCGLAASSEMMSDQFGETITENDVVAFASGTDLCATAELGYEAEDRGATSHDSRHELLSEYVDLKVEKPEGASLAVLAEHVEAGDGVLAAVKAAEYWSDDDLLGLADGEPGGTDHVVWVTGVERDRSGTLTGFIVNDTALDNGAGLRLDNNQMSRAWEERGGKLNIARRRTP